jgi:hypothetical protein
LLGLPPGCSADDVERLADWVEASALADSHVVSKAQIMEELQAHGLVLPQGESFGEDEDELGTDLDEVPSDALERLADDIIGACQQRLTTLGVGYPFVLGPDMITINSLGAHDSYAFLLVADLGHHYPSLKDSLTPDADSGRLMEKVVEAATKGLFGKSQRFGWPKEPQWPTGIDERVRRLADELGVLVDSLEGKTDPADNDRTLDVVGMFAIGDSYEASLTVLVQCAAGQNWKSKLGDPSASAWDNLLQWKSPIIRAVALPWRLGGRRGDWSYGRIYSLSNGAMVLDRPRLLAGNPDLHLDPAIRSEVTKWWADAIEKIPASGLYSWT